MSRVRPLLLLVALNLHVERLEGLPELLEEEDGIDPGAGTERAEEHLGGPHPLIVTEDRRLVSDGGVAGVGVDFELDFLASPARDRFLHDSVLRI